MTEPVSWQVIQYVLQRLQGIRIENGYYTDLGTYAQYSDRTQVDDASPYVLVVATAFEAGAVANTRVSANEDMTLLVEFAVPRTPELWPERAVHRARADIRRALAQVGRNEGPAGLTSIVAGDSSLGDAPDGANLIIAQVSARAGLTDIFPPATA